MAVLLLMTLWRRTTPGWIRFMGNIWGSLPVYPGSAGLGWIGFMGRGRSALIVNITEDLVHLSVGHTLQVAVIAV